MQHANGALLAGTLASKTLSGGDRKVGKTQDAITLGKSSGKLCVSNLAEQLHLRSIFGYAKPAGRKLPVNDQLLELAQVNIRLCVQTLRPAIPLVYRIGLP